MADAQVDPGGKVIVNTEGQGTTEYIALKQSNFWSNITMLAGIIVGAGPQILTFIPQESKTITGIIGGLVAISGVILRILANQNYNTNRTLVKQTLIQAAVDASAIQSGITPAATIPAAVKTETTTTVAGGKP